MAKHLIGFGLFISIVGFFGTAFWLFSSSPVREVQVVDIPNSVRSWSYCDKKRRSKDVATPRAVADRRSGTVTVYLNEIPGASQANSREQNASFTFYAVRGDEIRVVNVVHDSLVRTVRRGAETKWTLQYDAPWVKALSLDDNLYVVPGANTGSKHKSSFSIDSAMPVLIKN